MITDFSLGDTVKMKKQHPCGENEWTIIRSGADVKIKCKKCGHIVMMDRADFSKACKKIIEHHSLENEE